MLCIAGSDPAILLTVLINLLDELLSILSSVDNIDPAKIDQHDPEQV